MAKYVLNSQLKPIIENSPHKQSILAQNYITSDQLKPLVLAHKNPAKLLAHLQFYFPSKPKQPQSAKFKAQLDRLRAQEQEREYQQMIKSEKSIYDRSIVTSNHDEEFDLSPSQFTKQVKEQLTTIVNILVTCGSVAFAVWYWTKSSMDMKVSTRVFLSLFFGLLVLVAEVVVYNGYLRRMEEAKVRERQKKEVKKVVETIVLEGGAVN